jgi:putative nucleotidyltransferase with HDIG domain
MYLWSGSLQAVLALPAIAAMTGIYQVVDAAVVVGAITLSSNDRPGSVFARIARDAFLPELSLVLVGVSFAMLWHYSIVLSLLGIVPIWLSLRAFESVGRLRQETVQAVLRMAESIDYRDTNTYEHSQRIADLTRRLAVELGLAPEHVADIVLSSRVHDLGKIGISNEILFKTGPLTMEERGVMEEHTVIGANILSSYSAFKDSVAIVRHHHEHWDGSGYPDGLKGEDIPVGSRVIGVVDAFDAMTADRPYRMGMPVVEAVRRLKDGIGTQFDPRICAVFIQVLIEDRTYLPPPSTAPPDLRILTPTSNYG